MLRAFERWRATALNRFVGMFSMAIHDAKRRILFCACDPFGIKPFYYSQNAVGFSFRFGAVGAHQDRANAAQNER